MNVLHGKILFFLPADILPAWLILYLLASLTDADLIFLFFIPQYLNIYLIERASCGGSEKNKAISGKSLT